MAEGSLRCALLAPGRLYAVCTTELGAVAKRKTEFDRRNVKVLAVSVDPLDSHHAWIKDINETQACTMNFPLRKN